MKTMPVLWGTSNFRFSLSSLQPIFTRWRSEKFYNEILLQFSFNHILFV